jgi:hypothetical protein|tara:strand:- start:360 stop:500 length:141 start_codon:yes stop_codon:yes gene_type:complete
MMVGAPQAVIKKHHKLIGFTIGFDPQIALRPSGKSTVEFHVLMLLI